MSATTMQQIEDFLAHKRFAIVGVSRNPRSDSRQLFTEFRRRGYDVIPVNPVAGEVDGLRSYPSLRDISPPVEAVLLMTKPGVTDEIVRDCDTAGVRVVWMYRGAGQGAVSAPAVTFCESRGISVIAGECPFMFLPETQFVHRCHGFIKKVFGKYPQ